MILDLGVCLVRMAFYTTVSVHLAVTQVMMEAEQPPELAIAVKCGLGTMILCVQVK